MEKRETPLLSGDFVSSVSSSLSPVVTLSSEMWPCHLILLSRREAETFSRLYKAALFLVR